ncbi:14136_t:CDS:2 [Rhizophagus irregularis]|nr:14136_t:CDS:2 [Rhizophagus irregularis]
MAIELPLISNATDVGILHIEAMKRSLKYLKVGYNCVTDKGVKELEGLSKLTFLNLDYTKVSLSCKQILSW